MIEIQQLTAQDIYVSIHVKRCPVLKVTGVSSSLLNYLYPCLNVEFPP